MKSGMLWEHRRGLGLSDFGRDLSSSESGTARRNFVFFCQVSNSWPPISPQPNFTEFEHNTLIGETVNPFRTEFWKVPHKGSFFQKKNAKVSFKNFNIFQLQAAITPQRLYIDEKKLPNHPSTGCLHCVSKKGYHPTTNVNFNNCCPIPVIFGTNIAE